MSIVACRILPNGFEMCADSIMVDGYTQFKGENQKCAKLYEINNVVIGGVGLAEGNSLMQLFLETHGISRPDESGILEFISEFSDWKKHKTDNGTIDTSFLIGYKGKVFDVEGWFISEIKTYAAIGAGMDYALTALYLGESAYRAVEVATELSVYCEKPIITIRKQ